MYSDSRYADGYIYKAFDSRTGKIQHTVFRKFPTLSTTIHYYVWTETDRIDALAHRLYGDEDRWWMIMDVNPEISDPLNIPPGTTLRIPNA